MLHRTIKKNKNDEIFSPIGIGWKKSDVEQRDKSHVDQCPQGKKKHMHIKSKC